MCDRFRRNRMSEARHDRFPVPVGLVGTGSGRHMLSPHQVQPFLDIVLDIVLANELAGFDAATLLFGMEEPVGSNSPLSVFITMRWMSFSIRYAA